jgi:hypothetical protein
MKYYILGLIPFIVIAGAGVYLYIITSANRYIPEIKITVSEDGGRTYTNNLKSIPSDRDIYVKCEVSVKANGLLWRLRPKSIEFTIEPLKEFELCDYTGLKAKPANTFYVVVSNRPKKTEVIFKLPKGNKIGRDSKLTVSFKSLFVKKVYDKTVTLGFVPFLSTSAIGNVIVFGNLNIRTSRAYKRKRDKSRRY